MNDPTCKPRGATVGSAGHVDHGKSTLIEALTSINPDRLLEEKLEELTPEIVKSMMERIIRDHLGWLIVWGNVFGAAIGLLARGIAVHWHL